MNSNSTFKKTYCGATQPNQTLADAVAQNGKITGMPAGVATADEPSEKVVQLAEQIMSISFLEAAQLSTLPTSSYSLSLLSALFSLKKPFIWRRVAIKARCEDSTLSPICRPISPHSR